MQKNFADDHPNFRLITCAFTVYWTLLITVLLFRKDLEFGDTFSFGIYSMFLLTHLSILLLTYLTDRLQKGQGLLFAIAILPSILSALALVVSVLSFLYYILELTFN
jgi:hypothetical protein